MRSRRPWRVKLESHLDLLPTRVYRPDAWSVRESLYIDFATLAARRVASS